jgi:hypothetical protein
MLVTQQPKMFQLLVLGRLVPGETSRNLNSADDGALLSLVARDRAP